MPIWRSIPASSTYALTTIFTAPQWCSSLLYTWHPLDIGTIPAPSVFLRAQAQDDKERFANKYADCYPPEFSEFAILTDLQYEQTFTKFWDVVTAHTGINRGIYSPGVCPSGWSSWQVSGSSSWYNCCPLGFSWSDWQACKSSPTTATVVALNGKSETRTIHPPYILADWPILIAYASSDLDNFTPASAPLLLHKVNEHSINGSNRLSTSAKVGIGVGVAVACVALIALLATMLLLRRKRRKLEGESGVPGTGAKQAPDSSADESQEAVDIAHKGASSIETSEIARATDTATSADADYVIDNISSLHHRVTQ